MPDYLTTYIGEVYYNYETAFKQTNGSHAHSSRHQLRWFCVSQEL
jgi:hypothetical protein